MSKFRKRSVIEARQFTLEVSEQVPCRTALEQWCGGSIRGVQLPSTERVLQIRTPEGEMEARVGDWIIRGIAGEFYPCRPDIFHATYESVGGSMRAFGSALPPGVTPPHGRDAVYQFAGFNKNRDVDVDGRFKNGFELQHIVRRALPRPMIYSGTPITRLASHVKVADYLDSALREIAEHQLDLWLRIMPYGGGFQPRLIRGGDEWSMHSFGLAHDFDPAQNPLGWLPRDCRLGSTPEGTAIVEIFESWGFFWGGHFSGRKDCQHFQWATGC